MASSAMPKLPFTQADNQVSKKPKKVTKSQSAKETYRLTNWSEYNKALITEDLLRFGLVKIRWRIGIIKVHASLAASFAIPTSAFRLLWLSKQSFDWHFDKHKD